MKKSLFAVVCALSLFAACLIGCGSGAKNANGTANASLSAAPGENPNSAKTNIEELKLLINVPYDADDLVWKEDTAHKKLVAVLHFSKADADKLAADAAAKQAPQNVSIPCETWYPDELTAQSEMSVDNELQGQAYPANDFFMEPYTSGRLVRVQGSDYFVLQLTSK